VFGVRGLRARGRRKEEGGRRKEEGGRRKEEGEKDKKNIFSHTSKSIQIFGYGKLKGL
jgi:hypothetical protein